MYCGKCGEICAEGEELCPRCGIPAGNSMAALVAEAAEQGRFERAIIRLNRFWLLFAGLNLALAAAAGPALRERTAWEQRMAVAASVVALTQFPTGLVPGAYTLVKLAGRRNAALYEKLA